MKAFARRRFLKNSAALTGGLVIGFHLPAAKHFAQAQTSQAKPFYPPNAFIRIGADESITILSKHSEMGQGVYTSLAMLIAEELECDFAKIRVEAAPNNPLYNHTAFGAQITGGSSSIANSWQQLREVGAMARSMLITAAANEWKVDPASCRAENGLVIHEATKRRLSFGKLADKANQLPLPKNLKLKDAKDFKLIGKSIKRVDSFAKSTGRAQFGLDVRRPDMLYAVIARSPVFGGKVKSFNSDKLDDIPGLRFVAEIPSGVAIIGSSFWSVKKGRDVLQVEWDLGEHANLSTDALREQYRELAKKPGLVARKQGDVNVMNSAARVLSAEYDVPFLAHAPMEPLNCVIDLRADRCEIWAGSQFQTGDVATVARVAELKPEQVVLHTTYLGGGFGRRANPLSDYLEEAAHVARAVRRQKARPVMIVWTREDDIKGGYYRPLWYDRISAGLDAQGKPIAWSHTIVGQSIVAGTPLEQPLVKDGIDGFSVEGAADLPYAIPNMFVDLHSPRGVVPVQWWRSVGHSHTAFVVESFIDELAHAAKQDPVAYRLALLDKHPKEKAVLELAAQKAGWGKPLPKGRAHGVAVHSSFGSTVAQVAEVSIEKNQLRVHKVTCVIDCGIAVNPDGIKAQMESGIVFGLSAALYGAITIKDGRVEQSNFHDYPLLRFNEMPQVDVHIVTSQAAPTGVGEPGTPPIAPAVANAVFALTGKRLRQLPLKLA